MGFKEYTLKLNYEETITLYSEMCRLTRENLNEWTELVPKDGEEISEDCSCQWKQVLIYDSIRQQAAELLGYDEPEEEPQKIVQLEAYRKMMHVK